MDELFGTRAVKVPFSGAGFKEIRENLERAFESDNQIKYVLWGIDYNALLKDADFVVISDDYKAIATYSEGRIIYDREKDVIESNTEFIKNRNSR